MGDGENDSASGYINSSGKFVINPTFPFASTFSEGLALVGTRKNECSYIDLKGEVRIPGPFSDGKPFEGGRATVAMSVGSTVRWGVIDHDGKTAVPFISEEPIEFHGGFAAVKLKGRYGFIRE